MILLRIFHREQDQPCVKNLEGSLQIKQIKQLAAKASLSVFP